MEKKKRRLKNPKRKGIVFERKTRKVLEAQGFFCVRQAASIFPDIVAIAPKTGEVHFIECKVKAKYFSRREREYLLEMQKKYNVKPFLAYKKREGRYVNVQIDPVVPLVKEKEK